MPTFPRIIGFGMLVIASALSGCYSRWVSVASIEPYPSWRSEQHGWLRQLYGPGVEIGVAASNVAYDPEYSSSSHGLFGISLRFDVQGAGFQFSPKEVILIMPPNIAVAPKRYNVSLARSGDWECGTRKFATTSQESFSIPSTGLCAELYFEVLSPSPNAPFNLRIAGLTRDGSQIAMPELQFRPGKYWVWDFLGR